MKSYALPISIIVLAIALLISVFMFNTKDAIGSVISGGEYRAVAITTTGTSTAKTLFGSIGSVVITNGGSTGSIHFYDTSSTTIATSSATEIFSVDGAAVENTYQYDVAFGSGLLIEARGIDGEAVVTIR